MPTQAGVTAVVADPANPLRLYAAGAAGVVRSGDSGRTWEVSSTGLESVEVVALALNPTAPEMIFAAVANGDLYHSADGATTWQRVGP